MARLSLPAFFPDATYGTVRATGMAALESTGTPGVVMNTYHLYNRPGARLISRLGGLHRFTGWPRAILTDSGGFQLFSLIRENPDYGEIRRNEIVFRPERGNEKLIFTPEKMHTCAVAVRLGHTYGAGRVHASGRPGSGAV